MNEPGITRKERERLSRKNEIIAAAREVFCTHGFNDATLDEIAVKAEFGKGTLYNYFQGKEDLYEAVLAELFDECQGIADDAFTIEASTFRESSERFATGLLKFFCGNSGLLSLLMREMHRPQQHSLVRQRIAELVSRLEESLIDALNRQEIKPCRTQHVSFLFIATIFSLFHKTMYERCGDDVPSQDRQVSAFDDHEIRQIVDEALELLDVTFYSGVLMQSASDPTYTIPSPTN